MEFPLRRLIRVGGARRRLEIGERDQVPRLREINLPGQAERFDVAPREREEAQSRKFLKAGIGLGTGQGGIHLLLDDLRVLGFALAHLQRRHFGKSHDLKVQVSAHPGDQHFNRAGPDLDSG